MKIKSVFDKLQKIMADNEKYIKILRSKGVVIGNDCVIDKTAEFGTEPYLISLADHVRITKGVCFITHDGGLWVPRKMGLVDAEADRFGKIYIGENTNIGWNAIIMPGVHIGKNCIIGCGAVVTKNVPDNSVAAGIPAKVIETIEEYSNKNRSRCFPTKSMSYSEKKAYLLKMYSEHNN